MHRRQCLKIWDASIVAANKQLGRLLHHFIRHLDYINSNRDPDLKREFLDYVSGFKAIINQHTNIRNIVTSVNKAFKNAAKEVIGSTGEAVQIALNGYISSAATDNSPSGIADNDGERVHECQNAPSS